MGRKRGGGARARAKKKAIMISSGISLAILLLLVFLGSVVILKNKSDCDEIGVGAGLFGCNAQKEYAFDRIFFVVGNTANTPKPIINTEGESTLKKIISNSYIDGCPDIQLTSVASRKKIKYSNPECKEGDNATDRVKKRVRAEIEKLNEALETPPESDGAEYLETIYSVANRLQSSDSNQRVLLIVIGSGLSDSGRLNFPESNGELLTANSESVLQELEEKHAISEDRLQGITVFWYGLGAVSSPQQPLEQSQKENLQEIYRTILEEQGAKMFRKQAFEPIVDDESVETDKTVETTPITSVQCIFCNEGKTFNESYMAFKVESNDFTDETRSKAEEIINQVYSELSSNALEKIEIIAYRASMSDECSTGYYQANPTYNRDYLRANRVKELIVAKGIDPSRIDAKGGGVPEDDCSGEEARKKNRKVTIRAIRE